MGDLYCSFQAEEPVMLCLGEQVPAGGRPGIVSCGTSEGPAAGRAGLQPPADGAAGFSLAGGQGAGGSPALDQRGSNSL